MLHIILVLLKIIGILLLVILGAVLFLVLAGLFIPLCYRLQGEKTEESIKAGADLSWLFHLIHVKIRYEEGKPAYECYVLGIPILRLRNHLKKKKKPGRAVSKKRKAIDKKHPYEAKESNQETEKETQTEYGEKDIPQPSATKVSRWKRMIERIVAKIKTILGLPRKIYYTIQKNYGKIREWIAILKSDDVKYLKDVGIKKSKAAWKHVRPRRIRGSITFGMSDPANTGQILGVVAVLYPRLPRKLAIVPDFTEAVLKGWLVISGRMYGIFFLAAALQIVFDGQTISIIKKMMHKEA